MTTPAAAPESGIAALDEVRCIVALDEQPVLRNLLATQGFHELGAALQRLTRSDDINWCTLAAWASKTVGRFVRQEAMPGLVRALAVRAAALGVEIHHVEEAVFGRRHHQPHTPLDEGGLLALTDAVLADVTHYITLGNARVFAEMGAFFAELIDALGGEGGPDAGKLAALQSRLFHGAPAADEVKRLGSGRLVAETRGGQSLLAEAADRYHAAVVTSDDKQKAEHMLAANALCAVHEQTRLQPYIAGALNAPLRDLLLLRAHEHRAQHASAHGRVAALEHSLHGMLDGLFLRVERLWDAWATASLMELELPGGVLHVGSALPINPQRPLVPPALVTLDDERLRALLAEHDALELRLKRSPLRSLEERIAAALGLHPDPASFIDAAALNWVDLRQRLRYILTLLRARQQDPELRAPPFGEEQVAALRAGKMPEGRL